VDSNECWPHMCALRVESLAVVGCRVCERNCARVAHSKQSPHAIQQPRSTRLARIAPPPEKGSPCAAMLFSTPILGGQAVVFREQLTA